MGQMQSRIDSRIKIGSIVSRIGTGEFRVTEFTHGCCGGSEQIYGRKDGHEIGPFYTNRVSFVRQSST